MDQLSYDAIRKRGQFASHNTQATAAASANIASTYVLQPPQGTVQYQIAPPPGKQQILHNPNSGISYVQEMITSTPSALGAVSQKPPSHTVSQQLPNTQVIQQPNVPGHYGQEMARQGKVSVAATVQTPSPSLPASGVTYHTSPGKNTESPKKYLILDAGGAYYHQYTQGDC